MGTDTEQKKRRPKAPAFTMRDIAWDGTASKFLNLCYHIRTELSLEAERKWIIEKYVEVVGELTGTLSQERLRSRVYYTLLNKEQGDGMTPGNRRRYLAAFDKGPGLTPEEKWLSELAEVSRGERVMSKNKSAEAVQGEKKKSGRANQIMEHSGSAICRWAGKKGLDATQFNRITEHHGFKLAEAGVASGLYDGRKERGGYMPELTAAQEKELLAIAGAPAPKKERTPKEAPAAAPVVPAAPAGKGKKGATPAAAAPAPARKPMPKKPAPARK